MTTCTIRPALAADVAGIVNLAATHNLANKSPEKILQEGFLMSGYPTELYHRWLPHLRVATVNDEIAGFTLRFRRSEMPPEVDDFAEIFAEADDRDFLLFKQVGISLQHQHQGLGRRLYSADLDELPGLAFAPIIIAPVRNRVSIGFHESLGFRCARTYHIGEMDRGLWRRC